MSRSEHWRTIIRRELHGKQSINLAVTIHSSARFMGKVYAVPEFALVLHRSLGTTERSTYVELEDIAAIEVV